MKSILTNERMKALCTVSSTVALLFGIAMVVTHDMERAILMMVMAMFFDNKADRY